MVHSSRTIIFAVAILFTIAVAYGVSHDFSDYYEGHIICANRRKIKLGFTVSDEFKHLMEVQHFQGKRRVNMYVRIASTFDPEEVKDAQRDYEETKKKIEERHNDTISRKQGQPDRRMIGIVDSGLGTLQKEGKEYVPCYYFVVEYNDDFSDYWGGTIVCQDGNSSLIKLDQLTENWKNEYTHTFKVKTFKGKIVRDTYVRFAPLSNFLEVITTIGDWENTMLEIENPEKISYKESLEEVKQPCSIPSEGNGILKKDGKDDVSCYYFLIDYCYVGRNSNSSKK